MNAVDRIFKSNPELETMFEWYGGGDSALYSIASRMLSGEEQGDRFLHINLAEQEETDRIQAAIADLKHSRMTVEVNSEIYSKDGDVPTMLKKLDVAIAYLEGLA